MNKNFYGILLRRLATSVIVLFLMITFLFILLRISPGDPAQKFISPELSPEAAERVRESFDLNSNIFVQYKSFLTSLIRGDLGTSYNYHEPVLEVISQYLPFTIIFSLISFFIQITVGSVLALIAVRKNHGTLDKIITKFSLLLYALPTFVIGVILILLFSDILNLLPSSGIRSFDFESLSFFGKVKDYALHLIMPIITLSLSGSAIFFRYLRDGLEETQNKPFVLNLKANGLDEKTITLTHVLPNAVGPLISVAGVELGMLLGGTLITEVIFGLPGMGRLTVNAIMQRDYPLIIGSTLIAGVFVIICNMTADIIKAKIDKRLVKDILN